MTDIGPFFPLSVFSHFEPASKVFFCIRMFLPEEHQSFSRYDVHALRDVPFAELLQVLFRILRKSQLGFRILRNRRVATHVN